MVGKDLIMATLFGSGGSSGSGGGSSGSGGGSSGVKVAYGSYTPTEKIDIMLGNDNSGATIEHSLGVVPDFFVIGQFRYELSDGLSVDTYIYRSEKMEPSGESAVHVAISSASNNYWRMCATGRYNGTVTENEIEILAPNNVGGSVPYLAATEYQWIAIGGLSE